MEYKNVAYGEQWVEVERYILKAVSGKDSFRSKEFARLFEDIRIGRINTVICTALDRISRPVKDFLNFFEILNKYNVEFVCLKQNYDTTSSHLYNHHDGFGGVREGADIGEKQRCNNGKGGKRDVERQATPGI